MRTGIVLAALAFGACGGSSSSQSAAQIQLTAAGASPSAITLPSGGQVHFVNQDSAAHQIASTTCSEMSSPQLGNGQDFLTSPLTGPKTCSFNDGLNPSNANFSGTVTVNAPGTGGGGSGY